MVVDEKDKETGVSRGNSKLAWKCYTCVNRCYKRYIDGSTKLATFEMRIRGVVVCVSILATRF